MGSSQAIGSFADALAWSIRALAPGGTALFADGYLEGATGGRRISPSSARPPTRCARTPDNAAARARRRLPRAATMTSNDDEWDEYEGLYCAAMERYVDAHPDDPDAGRWPRGYAGGTTRTCAGAAIRWASASTSC